MKVLLLFLVVAVWQLAGSNGGTRADPRHMRWERGIAAQEGGGCVVLDAAVLAHAAASLKDVRLFAGGKEVPYWTTMSQAAQPEGDAARVLNLAAGRGGMSFDLEMPDRAYTDVVLELGGKDFQLAAVVSGSDVPGRRGTELGRFVLFDMTSKGLFRDTTLGLQESRFRYLHVVLAGTGATVKGAQVPPSREAQTVYTVVARAEKVEERGNETVATFRVPARVPVERVVIGVKDGSEGNFSRAVRVTARADDASSGAEMVEGTVMRVKMGEMRKEEMGIPASLGANLQGDATVEVAIENGLEKPLPVGAVMLAMRERRVCFAEVVGTVEMLYGDPGLSAPVYLGVPAGSETKVVALGAERANDAFVARVDERTFLGKHPELIWAGLLVGLGLAGSVALRVSRRG